VAKTGDSPNPTLAAPPPLSTGYEYDGLIVEVCAKADTAANNDSVSAICNLFFVMRFHSVRLQLLNGHADVPKLLLHRVAGIFLMRNRRKTL
jgi:hypothetical protein